VKISDPRAIKALAHPIRLDLLELVGRSGPVTAAQCGRALGESQASCSFHLRQLAKYGFVADAGPGRDRRERLWRITDMRLQLPSGQGPEGAVVRQLNRVMVERELARILDSIERTPDEPADWREASSTLSATIPLTAQDLAEIKESWIEVLAPYIAAAEAAGGQLAPGQRHVRFFSVASPLPELRTEGAEGAEAEGVDGEESSKDSGKDSAESAQANDANDGNGGSDV